MVGLRHTSAIHGALLITLAPVFMFAMAALGRGEGVTRAKVAGFLIAIAGSALVVTEGQLDAVGLDTRALGGDLLLILSAGGWALYSTLGKGLLRRHPPLLIVTLTFALNTLLLLPAALWGADPLVPFPRLSGTTWLAVLFLAWGCSALGYAMWYRALQRWDISQVSIFQYLQPLIAAVLGLFLLGETIGVATFLGGVATVGGVALVNRG
jgi:drug/metabolite transporter (DMT)-like permease